jgi:hypothetical protein
MRENSCREYGDAGKLGAAIQCFAQHDLKVAKPCLKTVRLSGLIRRGTPLRVKAVVYYVFFASQKPVAKKIITDIFKKYRD